MKRAVSFLAVLLLAACANNPPPPDWLLTADTAINSHARL